MRDESASVATKTQVNRRWLAKNPTYYQEWRARKPEYSSWKAMVQRCTNPNSASYSDYGGRGIKIHERWRSSFKEFLEHIGPRPGPGWSIDRIDNSGNYEPGNVRWATRSEQQQNRRPAPIPPGAMEMMAKLRSENVSWREIARKLNDAQVPALRGSRWYGNTAKDCFVRAAIDA